MMRPLPFAACLAIAIAAFAASAQTPAAQSTGEDSDVVQAPAEPAEAAPAAAPAVVGNVENGREITYTCMGCHGITGYQNAYPTYHVPRIGGQSPQYLINALTEYKQGTRTHPTMQAQSESFSEQQIADIAAYLSSLKK